MSSMRHLHLLQMSTMGFSEFFIAAIFKMPILARFLTLILVLLSVRSVRPCVRLCQQLHNWSAT